MQGNLDLRSIDGFNALESIGGELFIDYNESLTSIDGFASLTEIGGTLSIGDYYGAHDGNDSLEDVTYWSRFPRDHWWSPQYWFILLLRRPH